MMTTVFKIIAALAAFGGFHSLLASRQMKSWVAKRLGENFRDSYYRPFFIFQSLLTSSLLVSYILRLPDRPIYRVKPPLSYLFLSGQLAGLILAVWAAATVGISRISGLRSLLEGVAEPEAQGPARSSSGEIIAHGPFQWMRHPLNFSPLPIFWLIPTMTVRLLTINLVATIYLYLGSIHEETRLKAAYGQPYQEYLQSGVPFFFPRLFF